jgi:hypothetical protein
LNGALVSQNKRFEKILSQQAEQFKATLENLTNTLAPPAKEPLPSKQEMSDDVSEFKRQIKVLMERDKIREEQDKKTKLSTTLREQLNKAGIRSKDEIALKFLQDQVSFDEDGQVVMRIDDGPPLPVNDAVMRFVQTDHGKFLADPKDIRGSGSNNIINQNSYRGSSNDTPVSQITNNGEVPIFKDAKSLKQYTQEQMSKGSLKY